jgi:hypothetical protein
MAEAEGERKVIVDPREADVAILKKLLRDDRKQWGGTVSACIDAVQKEPSNSQNESDLYRAKNNMIQRKYKWHEVYQVKLQVYNKCYVTALRKYKEITQVRYAREQLDTIIEVDCEAEYMEMLIAKNALDYFTEQLGVVENMIFSIPRLIEAHKRANGYL